MWEQIQSNRRKTAVLVISMAALLFVLGYVIAEALAPGAGIMGLALAGGVWALLTLIAFAQGDNIVLALSGAKEIEKQDHPELFNVVEEMTIASGLGKMPRVYLVPDDAMNAFAVGRNKDKAAVAVTAGLLGRLDRDELQGVVAHEIGHVVNRDVLLMTMLSVLLGAIVMTSEIFLRSLRFGAGRGARYAGRGRGKGAGQGAAIMLVLALVLALLAPLLAQLIYFAVSRRREYLADAASAVYTRYPEGLASALEKLAGAGIPVERASKATAAMYIVNPFAKASLSAYTSTHPPAAARIQVLRSLGATATFASYQQAWKNELKKKAGPLPASALHDTAHGGPVRAASPPAGITQTKDPREQARQVGDLLRGLNQFVFLPCACGLKLKLPPNYPHESIECPRCHRQLRVPIAELAATQVAAEHLSGKLEALTGIPTATPRASVPELPATGQSQVIRRKPGEWMTFQCACGRLQTLSPAIVASRVKCPNCGRETRLLE